MPLPRAAPPSALSADARSGAASGGEPVVHAVAVVRSDEELFGASASWVQQGIDAGDLVVIAGSPSFQQSLAEEFGEADRVEFDDRVRKNGRRAPDVVGAIVALSHRAAEGGGSARLRILSQVDQPDDPRIVREQACMEAAVNLAPIVTPAAALCLYDERHLPSDLVRIAAETHPDVLAHSGLRSNPGYVDPHEFVRGLPVPREPLQDGPPVLAVDDAPSLAGLRHALGEALVRKVPDRDQREDLHLAVSEMAANAFRHAGRPVSARLWASRDRLVCTISDSGRGLDPLYGYWPAHGEDLGRGGMGLWLARKLCDHVDIDSSGGGTTVRLATVLR